MVTTHRKVRIATTNDNITVIRIVMIIVIRIVLIELMTTVFIIVIIVSIAHTTVGGSHEPLSPCTA